MINYKLTKPLILLGGGGIKYPIKQGIYKQFMLY